MTAAHRLLALTCVLVLAACGGPDSDTKRRPAATPATPAASAPMPEPATESAPPSEGSEADVAGLRAAGDAWLLAFSGRDADKLAQLYADDAVVMPEAEPSASGAASINGFYLDYFGRLHSGSYSISVPASQIMTGASGDLGYRAGVYRMSDGTGTQVDTGKWLQVWRRAGGEWRVVRDTWNSDGLPVLLGDDSAEGEGEPQG